MDRERIDERRTSREAKGLTCLEAEAGCTVDQGELASEPELRSFDVREWVSKAVSPRPLFKWRKATGRDDPFSSKTLKINGFRAVDFNAKRGSLAPRIEALEREFYPSQPSPSREISMWAAGE